MFLVTKVDAMRNKRVKITDVDGDVFIGFAFQPCVAYIEETGEEVDAICVATESDGNMVFAEDDIASYEILD